MSDEYGRSGERGTTPDDEPTTSLPSQADPRPGPDATAADDTRSDGSDTGAGSASAPEGPRHVPADRPADGWAAPAGSSRYRSEPPRGDQQYRPDQHYRPESSRGDQPDRPQQYRGDQQYRPEQYRGEQFRGEQFRSEQNRGDQDRAEQYRGDQQRYREQQQHRDDRYRPDQPYRPDPYRGDQQYRPDRQYPQPTGAPPGGAYGQQQGGGAPFATPAPPAPYPFFGDDRSSDRADGWDRQPDEQTAVLVDEKPNRRHRLFASGAAALLAAVIVSGAVGGTAGYLAGRNDDTPVAASSNQALSAPVVQANDSTGGTSVVQMVARAVTPSVVQITERNGQSGGTGSGAIIKSDGTILTNNHVVAAAADGGTLVVTFSDGTKASARVLGRDPVTDLAVIKADANRTLPAINLGDSSKVVVGQSVIAFGSPLGLSGTVTTGIISALNRPVTTQSEDDSQEANSAINALQTDAAINPGNSGGPLTDYQGKLIGINSAIASLGSGSSGQSGSIGLGFSIPVNQIKPIIAQLEAGQEATHAVLGVQLSNATSSDGLTSGASLGPVTSNGAAAAAGLRQGDVITKVGDVPIADGESLQATIRSSRRPGEKVTITYLRDGQSRTADVTLGSD